MKTRTIKNILYAQLMDMGGMPVRQAFPSAKAERIDPFLLLHHADIKVPKHVETKHTGVGPHPHRGFSPVTFIFKGGVHHRDSRGNDNIIYAGGTQWMNAGMGIIHSERPPHDIHEMGSEQEIIQLWVNMPAQHKMDQPAYHPLTGDETPQVEIENGVINVIAGELDGVEGKIPTLSPVNAYTATFKKGAKYSFSIPSTHNAFVYLLNGKLNVNGTADIDQHFLFAFNQDGDGFTVEVMEDATFLVATGEPLNEPVSSHGPFVMNTQTEIMEAFRDYHMGKMGVLIED
jgi:redox-sensitive bicupin YhaK (pirin superfamily)